MAAGSPLGRLRSGASGCTDDGADLLAAGVTALAGGPFTAGRGDCGHRHAPGGEPGQLESAT
jgi:hypothetical protein